MRAQHDWMCYLRGLHAMSPPGIKVFKHFDSHNRAEVTDMLQRLEFTKPDSYLPSRAPAHVVRDAQVPSFSQKAPQKAPQVTQIMWEGCTRLILVLLGTFRWLRQREGLSPASTPILMVVVRGHVFRHGLSSVCGFLNLDRHHRPLIQASLGISSCKTHGKSNETIWRPAAGSDGNREAVQEGAGLEESDVDTASLT
ncbi:acetyl-synthetase [Moniliophthora roreri]|nr:acetyl-synthetase [Moniliophthora roreri]